MGRCQLALSRADRALGDDAREALIRDPGQALGTYTDDEGIAFPAETYLAVAHR